MLAHLPAGHAAYLTGRSFFPSLISPSFKTGLRYAFDFAIGCSIMAAIASLLRGGRYVHEAGRAHRRHRARTTVRTASDQVGAPVRVPGLTPSRRAVRPDRWLSRSGRKLGSQQDELAAARRTWDRPGSSGALVVHLAIS